MARAGPGSELDRLSGDRESQRRDGIPRWKAGLGRRLPDGKGNGDGHLYPPLRKGLDGAQDSGGRAGLLTLPG